MNENEQSLLEGLRALASDGPQQPPAFLEQRLLGEVRRKARIRRWKVWGSAAAVAAAILTVVLVSPMRSMLPQGAAATELAADTAQASQAGIETGEIAPGFYPVPGTEALPAFENAMVVRVEMPVSSLRMMGFPVTDGNAADSVEADVLLGQDGLARGVRVVDSVL